MNWNYTPQHSPDKIYTHQDFINLCKGNEAYARQVRFLCDWQHPETIIDEDLQEGHIIEIDGTYIIQH